MPSSLKKLRYPARKCPQCDFIPQMRMIAKTFVPLPGDLHACPECGFYLVRLDHDGKWYQLSSLKELLK